MWIIWRFLKIQTIPIQPWEESGEGKRSRRRWSGEHTKGKLISKFPINFLCFRLRESTHRWSTAGSRRVKIETGFTSGMIIVENYKHIGLISFLSFLKEHETTANCVEGWHGAAKRFPRHEILACTKSLFVLFLANQENYFAFFFLLHYCWTVFLVFLFWWVWIYLPFCFLLLTSFCLWRVLIIGPRLQYFFSRACSAKNTGRLACRSYCGRRGADRARK